MKTIKIFIFFTLFIFCGSVNNLAAQTMNEYCMTPSFISTAVKPNVLILMDFSGSMGWEAYEPATYGYSTATNYYGYFKTDKYYNYASSRFNENASCTNTDKIGSPDCISGNLLNWLTSSRVDVARKVLTGGRTSTGQADILESEGSSVSTFGGASTWRCRFTIDSSRRLTIANQSGYTCQLGTLSNANIKIKVEDVAEITGVVHEFYDKVDFEFMVYGDGSGSTDRWGEIKSGKGATLSSLVAAITNEPPDGYTPTGEALWEAYDYFKQSDDHNYEANTSDLGAGNGLKDPWYDGSGAGSTAVPCRKAFVLLISDGAWNRDVDPDGVARTMLINDIRTAAALTGTQNVRTYAVYAFGASDPEGRKGMITTALFGGFDDYDSNTWPYPFTTDSADSKTIAYPLTQCNDPTRWDSQCKEWDKDKDNLPDNFFEADAGDELETAIRNALSDMLRRASSGTAVSMLASSEGSGANLLQAVFYPKKAFGTTEIDWIGEIQNLWYYIDPNLQNSTIREDTDVNKKLHLQNDYVLQFYFDSTQNKTMVKRYQDTNGDGSGDTLISTVDMEDISNLWEAGTLLWSRNLGTSPRTIKTTTDGSIITDFSTANAAALRAYLQAATDAEAQNIIDYVHGVDVSGYRSRTVTIDSSSGVWKLGDIVSSTPRLQSSIRLNNYHLTPPSGYSDSTYSDYFNSNDYKNRGMVYVGGNDGMLHAFKLGKLEFTWTGQGALEKAQLSGSDLGKEEWAFIPKNSLPYLKYMTDTSYCHLFYIDGASYIFDATINMPSGCSGDYWDCEKKTTVSSGSLVPADTSWRTIIIGSMGLGGACRNLGASCTDCVKTPLDGIGYSSYFALDVTDPSNPALLWEFSNSALGFSTSGPAVIRVGDSNKNGRWFAVFASGPTGPIDTSYHQFLGKSDQNLKLFVLDLKTGQLLRTIDTGIANAFGGSLFNSPIDTDRWSRSSSGFYSDDSIYVGYVKKTGAAWTDGGVLRLLTKENTDPAQWAVSTVIDGVGPVTSAVSKLQDRNNNALWLFFGTGRFFYKMGDTIDDPDSQRAIYGIMEPCYKTDDTDDIDNGCTSSLTAADLDDQTTSPSAALASGKKGWYINLGSASSTNKAERVITDPLAAPSGAVFFTTFAPSSDICSMGGNTYLWLVKYNTGYEAATTLPVEGKALLQVSTGSVEEISFQTAFSEATYGSTATVSGRRSGVTIQGVPPKGQGLSVVVNPKAIKKIMHIREK